tara:strand:- start:130 stop:336 length:207 start_codon:yes stop_codon:yes gene_type:complete
MKIAPLLKTLGIALMLYALISGFHFIYNANESGSTFTSSYTLKFSSIVIGFILYFIGNRLEKKESEEK